ncbi:hypothetical protein E2C01_033708 [Portunus trituberculatus]|uniref:Uncharacterized protein n=1 Tax=Portunus trituberculatus TaxID=210409 RepID=A0A5B7F4W3_PORTR|nr:hypothetical protein [Portunus trituberculatus]
MRGVLTCVRAAANLHHLLIVDTLSLAGYPLSVLTLPPSLCILRAPSSLLHFLHTASLSHIPRYFTHRSSLQSSIAK